MYVWVYFCVCMCAGLSPERASAAERCATNYNNNKKKKIFFFFLTLSPPLAPYGAMRTVLTKKNHKKSTVRDFCL